jgi:2-oxoglutarate ferredoxin oxidoreductase subunit alpha
MHDKRRRKGETLINFLKGIKTINLFGKGEKTIITYGSTTISVLEALKHGGIEAKVVQPIYLEPLATWELEEFRKEDVIVVEQSSTGLFASLLQEKVGINPKAIIKKYDGRPFEPAELAEDIKEVL